MRIPFAYTSGLLIALGDRIKWRASGRFVCGGTFQESGVGLVTKFGSAYVQVQCDYGQDASCSQRFGSDKRDLSDQTKSLWFDGYSAESGARQYSGTIQRAD